MPSPGCPAGHPDRVFVHPPPRFQSPVVNGIRQQIRLPIECLVYPSLSRFFKMPYCSNCGQEQKGSFCINCGTAIAPSPTVPPPRPAPPPPPLAGKHLVCPSCVAQNNYQLPGIHLTYTCACPACGAVFQTRIVTVRAKNSNKRNHLRHFSVRVINAGHGEELIQFRGRDVEFDMRSGDTAVFSYIGGKIRLVQNLTIGKYMKVGGGCAFVIVVFATGSALGVWSMIRLLS